MIIEPIHIVIACTVLYGLLWASIAGETRSVKYHVGIAIVAYFVTMWALLCVGAFSGIPR